MSTATQTAPWQAQIIQQLEQLTADELAGKTHLVVNAPDNQPAEILELAETQAEAAVIAEDLAHGTIGSIIFAVPLTDIHAWMNEHTADLLPTLQESEAEVETGETRPLDDVLDEIDEEQVGELETGAEELGDGAIDDDDSTDAIASGTTEGPDASKGKLFDVKVKLDPTKPTLLKLAFAGSVELDVSKPGDVALYNALVAGKAAAFEVEAHVAGAKKTHRRDSAGDVDAVVETKSLVIHSIDLA